MTEVVTPVTLLIVDMDNTLYDWVGYFVPALDRMIATASSLLNVPEGELRRQLTDVHRKYGNTEHPFALLETEIVNTRYAGHARADIYAGLKDAFDAFDAEKKRRLTLYAGVTETLEQIQGSGCVIVGHTEAILESIRSRARLLNLDSYLSRIYAPAPEIKGHPLRHGDGIPLKIPIIRQSERKPSPEVVHGILKKHDIPPEEALYVGDSVEKDVGMALRAGVRAAWARYGVQHDPSYWSRLLEISHWAQVEKSGVRKVARCPDVESYNVIDSFPQLLVDYRFAEHK